MVGDVILVQEVDDIYSLAVGDVITYHGTIGEYSDMPITHQIVKAPYEEDGTTYVVTKGIANDVEDQPVAVSQIAGKLVCKIPFLDWVYGFFLTPFGLLSAIALIIFAFAGEFWNIYRLSHPKEETAKVDQQTLEKAIEQYQVENASGTPPDSLDAAENDTQDTQDNTNE